MHVWVYPSPLTRGSPRFPRCATVSLRGVSCSASSDHGVRVNPLTLTLHPIFSFAFCSRASSRGGLGRKVRRRCRAQALARHRLCILRNRVFTSSAKDSGGDENSTYTYINTRMYTYIAATRSSFGPPSSLYPPKSSIYGECWRLRWGRK